MKENKPNPWITAGLLTLPVLLCFWAYFANAGDQVAPGFFQNDNPLYVSYAHQYLDQHRFSLFYSNPFNESDQYPAIYFQVQNFLYTALLYAGIAPGWVLILCTLVFSLLFFRILIALLDRLIPPVIYRNWTLLLFAWGGGLLFLAGIPASFARGLPQYDQFDNFFLLDPGWGWWGLNLGRALLFSAEAYYHCLFFMGILLLVKEKWNWALLTGLLLMASHPFTGIEYLLIVTAWAALEKLFCHNKRVPWRFLAGMLLLLAVHVGYYLFYLPGFADHASVQEQYSINWRLRYFNILPAYGLIFLFAAYSVFKLAGLKKYIQSPTNRLWIVWLLVVLLLTNHELFMKPMQPVHFTRGYLYASLFLMAIPALGMFYTKLRSARWGYIGIVFLSLLFLSDNIAWMANLARKNSKTGLSFYISRDENEVLDWLTKNVDDQTLILSSNRQISYLVPSYTNGHSWISQLFTTPFYARKEAALNAFITNGTVDSAWLHKRLFYIVPRQSATEMDRLNRISANANRVVYFNGFILAEVVLKR